ncbi:MAG: RNA pseudouridine synthase [Gammaproteobacteria bacterium]|nr:RNA pseudouridine synthase [Gammaproteobacteria bacterium]MBT3722983.1 RNA pseudouridine synthase [Gammaproteobacteria bacterium]MBT4078878.1 RNA pseudouridine synthase [Gammaproteobacteria bacterium]MBT4193775.1 RNA pseudouridine synthase [Gammaproteobacteria bacterium]MBT4449277.1 RNA pseudouridine synthase [Gammaproteobacteria bacterium]
MSEINPIEIHRQVIYKNQTALDLLKDHDELSPEQILLCFENGSVWLETAGKPQRIYNIETKLKPGHKIHCYCNSTTLADCPFKPELVADFDDFSIWNKPSGMLSQGSKWGDHWALYRWIKQNYWPERDSFITHRLDRFTSGLIVVAHNKTTNTQFHRLFENRKINKTYRAIVSGLMIQDQTLTLNSDIDNKTAKTQVKVIDLQQTSQLSLVEIKPETGRKHQIRVHLAETGHPVINDRQYGKPPFDGDLQLQASELEFSHPTKNESIHIKLNKADLLRLKKIR